MLPKEIIAEIVREIIYLVEEREQPLKNQDLLRICQPIGDFGDGRANPHFPHEIAEASLNCLIQEKYAANFLDETNPQIACEKILKPLVKRFPTQTWRSREQISYQQFSTPVQIAYLLAYLLNPKPKESVLEPSAGTGSLAVWASGAAVETLHTNEIDSRRRDLLRQIGFAPTAFDAEFINDFLPPETEIDCLLMNPPFSSNGERTKNNSSKYGFRHVESALERLKSGGKFGIILGEAAGLDTKTGRDFWQRLAERIEVKTIIKINGREYYKNGTTVDINLIVGKKLVEVPKLDWNKRMNQILCLRAESVEEAFNHAQRLNLRLNQ